MPPPIGYCRPVGLHRGPSRAQRRRAGRPCRRPVRLRRDCSAVITRQLRLARLTSRTPGRRRCAADARCCQRTAAPARSGTMPPSAVSCTASWSTRLVTAASGQKPHPTAPSEDVYPVADPVPRKPRPRSRCRRALMRLPVEQQIPGGRGHAGGYSIADTARMLGVAEAPSRAAAGRGPPSAASAGLSQHRE